MVTLPPFVDAVLTRLTDNGYEAYVVGGCVRDALIGIQPKDWDVCTSAEPDKVKACFQGYRLIETGLKHGTVTVLSKGEPVEITTFRTDGAYTDHRRPDGVTFVRDLKEDLSRRDFTVNAMAYRPDTGLIDLFGGERDLKNGLIRCVGDAGARFDEDGLRILRALRFAARFSFAIEPMTARALTERARLLSAISAERIYAELKQILTGEGAEGILTGYSEAVFMAVPALRASDAVWRLAARVAALCPRDPVMRLAALILETGEGGARADTIMRGLKTDNPSRERAVALARYKAYPMPDTDALSRRMIVTVGQTHYRALLDIRAAAARARGDEKALSAVAYARDAALRAIDAGACLSLRDLAIKGEELKAIGFRPGKPIGDALNALFAEVIDGTLPNERCALIARAETIFSNPMSRSSGDA